MLSISQMAERSQAWSVLGMCVVRWKAVDAANVEQPIGCSLYIDGRVCYCGSGTSGHADLLIASLVKAGCPEMGCLLPGYRATQHDGHWAWNPPETVQEVLKLNAERHREAQQRVFKAREIEVIRDQREALFAKIEEEVERRDNRFREEWNEQRREIMEALKTLQTQIQTILEQRHA